MRFETKLEILCIIAFLLSPLGSAFELQVSDGNGVSESSTDVKYGATAEDSVDHHVKINPAEAEIANSYFGTGSLPYATITKANTAKGLSSTAYRSINGKPKYSTWRYDWGTSTPSSSTAGTGVGTWLNLDVHNAYSFSGGSYGSNAQGDYASTTAVGSSPSGVAGASLSGMSTSTNAFTNSVSSVLSASMGTGSSYVWFDSSSKNKEGEYAWHWTDAYGTTANPAMTVSPYISASAQKSSVSVYGYTEGSFGTKALLRTHVEDKAKMYGHDGTYYSGIGEFGYQKNNYNQLTGSVSAKADASNVYLYPSVTVPSYRTAYLLDPYRYEWVTKKGYADWGYDAFYALMGKQQAVTYYANAAVSHSRVGDMDNYYISTISSHMGPNAIEVTRAADSDRVVTGSELASMFTKNPQGLIYLDGCSSFKPSATSALANAVKNKEWLSAGYTYDVNAKGDNLFMSKFFGYLAQGYTARNAQSKATTDVSNALGVSIVPTWTPSNHDFVLL